MSEETQVRPGVIQVSDINVGFYLSQDRTRAWISLGDMLTVEAGGKGEGISGGYAVQNWQQKVSVAVSTTKGVTQTPPSAMLRL